MEVESPFHNNPVETQQQNNEEEQNKDDSYDSVYNREFVCTLKKDVLGNNNYSCNSSGATGGKKNKIKTTKNKLNRKKTKKNRSKKNIKKRK
jgi:hypothetical protein